MFIQHNHLRACRKNSPLTQSDIAFLLQLSDESNISRWEQGQRSLNIDVLLFYHILFNTPIEHLIERYKRNTENTLCEKITSLVALLKKNGLNEKVSCRVTFLETVIKRLTS